MRVWFTTVQDHSNRLEAENHEFSFMLILLLYIADYVFMTIRLEHYITLLGGRRPTVVLVEHF